jgi:ADP-ribose pyrophosphatase YjhB (NUDIX family)
VLYVHPQAARIPCVGAIITDGDGRLLLVKRGHPPEAGRWSIPGGRIEPGESDQQALVREVREETGLAVTPGELAGRVERASTSGSVLDIRDYTATVTGGRLAAGDDAADTCWAGPAELVGLPLTRGLLTALTAWGVLGAAPPAAVIADVTRRAGLLWLSVPGQDRPYPAWHVWSGGGAYLVTGPGEQPLPGLADAGLVAVTVAAKDPGGHLITWQARVHRVAPGSPEWHAVAGQLEAARLNPAPGDTAPGGAGRWAADGAVFRLAPVS